MRVLGVDPGLVRTGFGAIEARGPFVELLEGGTIRPPTGAPLEERLRVLHESLAEVLDRVRPDATIVEEIYAKYAHPRTAILMGHARGVLLLASAERGIPVVGYAASRIKGALTGSGRAAKEQVQAMVAHLLHLPEPPKPLDVTDALALALCHASITARESLT